jgi:hypothetical protein
LRSKGPPRVGQVSDEKTNVCEPLLTHRKNEQRHQNRGMWDVPGMTAHLRCVLSQEATCVLSWWCPVYRWRELVVGAGMEQENLSFRYRWPVEMGVVGPLVTRGRTRSGGSTKGRVPKRSTGADRPVVVMKAL